METLLSLREKAQKLGIENYSMLSKDELRAKIAEMQNSQETEVENSDCSSKVQDDLCESSEEEKAEVAAKEEAGEVEEISAEEAAKLGKEQKVKKPTKKELKAEEKAKKAAEKEAAKKAEEEKKAAKKANREKTKKEKVSKTKKSITISYKLRGEMPEKLGETSQKVFDELMKNEGLSIYQIAKKCGTYFSVVDKVVGKYFDVEKTENISTEETTTEAVAE